jgi:hypothetical protein
VLRSRPNDTLQEEAQSEVVNFADAQRALIFGKTLPVNSPSGMSDSGAEPVGCSAVTGCSQFSHSSKRCWVCAASASGATWLALIRSE